MNKTLRHLNSFTCGWDTPPTQRGQANFCFFRRTCLIFKSPLWLQDQREGLETGRSASCMRIPQNEVHWRSTATLVHFRQNDNQFSVMWHSISPLEAVFQMSLGKNRFRLVMGKSSQCWNNIFIHIHIEPLSHSPIFFTLVCLNYRRKLENPEGTPYHQLQNMQTPQLFQPFKPIIAMKSNFGWLTSAEQLNKVCKYRILFRRCLVSTGSDLIISH